MNQDDHDIIIEIRNDLKHLMSFVKTHVEDDSTRFTRIDKKLEFQDKIIYGAVGVVVFIQFIIKVIT